MKRDVRLTAGVLGLALLCTLLQWLGLDGALRYERSAIAAGEVWRLVTGNFVHLGMAHLAFNLAALVPIALLVARRLPLSAWGLALLATCTAVGIGLWWFAPEVGWYVGLSGALYGLLATGALIGVLQGMERWFHGAILGFLAVKLGFEQFGGAVPGTEWLAGGRVVVDSHLFGVLGGLAAGGLIAAVRGRRRPAPS